ncbi:hypothetical protein [Nostoc sp.]|uniref:hypothetical protein n=1 Tax=Nostoc sp. TaxID=1180 RepID=UPI002FFB5016
MPTVTIILRRRIVPKARVISIGLTHELRNNVDAKRLAAGYRRGAEKPVRPCGSPTCSRSVSPWEKQLARHGEIRV